MNTKSKSINTTRPGMVLVALCITFPCLFSSLVAASGDNREIEDEGNKDYDFFENSEEDSTDSESDGYQDGLVWSLESEVVQITMPPDVTDNPNLSTDNSQYRGKSIALSVQWHGLLSDFSTGFVELSLSHERIDEPILQTVSDSFIELNQIWIDNRIPWLNSSLKLGLQGFEDRRGWWWNESLVGVQWLGFTQSDWNYSAAVLAATPDHDSRNIPAAPDERGIYYLLLHGQKELGDNSTLSLYGLHSADRSGATAIGTAIQAGFEDESDATLTHLGLGLQHELDIGSLGMLNLRGDIAFLAGDNRILVFDDEDGIPEGTDSAETDGDIEQGDLTEENAAEQLLVTGEQASNLNAWAVDLGLIWGLPVALKPSIELGFALGSGTASRQTRGSKTFRQTGLHDNSDAYGSVLTPDLSNLQVLSLKASLPISDTVNINLSHHRFHKVHASDEVAENELDLETESNSSDIGSETGLYVQSEVFDDVDVKLSLAQFRYGKAVTNEAKNKATRLSIEFSYEF